MNDMFFYQSNLEEIAKEISDYRGLDLSIRTDATIIESTIVMPQGFIKVIPSWNAEPLALVHIKVGTHPSILVSIIQALAKRAIAMNLECFVIHKSNGQTAVAIVEIEDAPIFSEQSEGADFSIFQKIEEVVVLDTDDANAFLQYLIQLQNHNTTTSISERGGQDL